MFKMMLFLKLLVKFVDGLKKKLMSIKELEESILVVVVFGDASFASSGFKLIEFFNFLCKLRMKKLVVVEFVVMLLFFLILLLMLFVVMLSKIVANDAFEFASSVEVEVEVEVEVKFVICCMVFCFFFCIGKL